METVFGRIQMELCDKIAVKVKTTFRKDVVDVVKICTAQELINTGNFHDQMFAQKVVMVAISNLVYSGKLIIKEKI